MPHLRIASRRLPILVDGQQTYMHFFSNALSRLGRAGVFNRFTGKRSVCLVHAHRVRGPGVKQD